MINFNLIRIARLKGITRPSSNLRSLGLKHGMIQFYLSGKHKAAKFADIEKICLAWHCTPNDLFEWTKGPTDADLSANHPLNVLHRTLPQDNIAQLMINASPEKLVEVQKLLKGE